MASINFYELLKLDPSVGDRSQIEKVIERNQREWVRWGDNPVRENEARRNLSLLPRIRKVLLGSEPEFEQERRSQAEALKGLHDADIEKLDQMIILESGGKSQIVDSKFKEFALICGKAFKNKFSEQQIRERCRHLRISIVGESAHAEPRPLDPATCREIKKNLSIAGDEDLYSLLKVPFGTKDCKKLLAAADSILKEARRRPTQAEWNAKAVLAGQCLVLFKNEEQRCRYDFSALEQKIGDLLDDMLVGGIEDGERGGRAEI